MALQTETRKDNVHITDTEDENLQGKNFLKSLLNKYLLIEMTDGRVLLGVFLCTDGDANIILGSCSEYLPQEFGPNKTDEPRILGLVMVPGKHIVKISKTVDLSGPLDLNSLGDVL